jgi:hypothetical protein
MKFDDDQVVFSSGKSEYAFSGIIGINSALELSYGYDGSLADERWTKEEAIELADYMIALWTKYKESHEAV